MRVYALRNLIGIAPFVAVATVAALRAIPRRAAVATGLAATATLLLPFAPLFGGTGGRPPYDAMARALVAQGWTPSQPVAVFGNFYPYRAPLEWYLPHRPLLEASRVLDGVCPTIFVIRGNSVARVHLHRQLESVPRLRGATFLANPAGKPVCVQPITTGRFAALA
jgi:hypothetical protein